ncbi:hypothetical protein Hanom_Chr09g00804771 [Helianthus anomalus]
MQLIHLQTNIQAYGLVMPLFCACIWLPALQNEISKVCVCVYIYNDDSSFMSEY